MCCVAAHIKVLVAQTKDNDAVLQLGLQLLHDSLLLLPCNGILYL